ncbi:gluconokinase [Vibrio cholerae]
MSNNIVVMGVSGSGKSAVGKAMAEQLGWTFFDGDDYHPHANVEKMRQGIPLTDEDRWEWLATLRQLLRERSKVVLACSALKPEYRQRLQSETDNLTFVYLNGEFDTILSRLKQRKNHYFQGEKMLRSQFDALVPPTEEEAIHVDIRSDIATVIQQALSLLNQTNSGQVVTAETAALTDRLST